MTLSKPEIETALEQGELSIRRPAKVGDIRIEPSSVDCHLGSSVAVYDGADTQIDVADESTYPSMTTYHDVAEVEIQPREFMLAHTQEVVALPDDIVGYLHGRSSVGRLSLFVENAGLVDAGFTGDLTLELFNAGKNPIVLRRGMRICQLTLHRHDEQPDATYGAQNGNKYQGQRGPTPSRLYEDVEVSDN